MKFDIERGWFEKRAAAAADLEISAGRRGLPPAYNNCTCSCHRGSGIIHFVACCAPTPAQTDRALTRAREAGYGGDNG
jgi:hypothetical protein